MKDGGSPVAGSDAFATIDPKLNVFALANSMDLTKGADYRRLEWFTQGLERGIRIEARPPGTFRVAVQAWPFGSDTLVGQSTISEDVDAGGVVELLGPAIDAANGLSG